MTEPSDELKKRLELAGITQPLSAPATQPRRVRKVRCQTVGGHVISEDVEELVTTETGSELRNLTAATKCKCGRVFHSLDDVKAQCWCGSSLCKICSEYVCKLDGCGKALCIEHRLRVADGVYFCVGHFDPNVLGALAGLGSNGMAAALSGSPRLGDVLTMACPVCNRPVRIKAVPGTRYYRCGFLGRKEVQIHVYQDEQGNLQVDLSDEFF